MRCPNLSGFALQYPFLWTAMWARYTWTCCWNDLVKLRVCVVVALPLETEHKARYICTVDVILCRITVSQWKLELKRSKRTLQGFCVGVSCFGSMLINNCSDIVCLQNWLKISIYIEVWTLDNSPMYLYTASVKCHSGFVLGQTIYKFD
jgi:hypothetical protein